MRRWYNYVGPSDIADRVRQSPAGTPVTSVDDIRRWVSVRLNGHRGAVTATYVVDAAGTLRLADRHSEHVACAAGAPVRAAGEITLAIPSGVVEVDAVTNLSTGYCPEPESWQALADALVSVGVTPPDGYEHAFEFRRCPNCRTTNVVKDGIFECAVCGAELPRQWNFDGR